MIKNRLQKKFIFTWVVISLITGLLPIESANIQKSSYHTDIANEFIYPIGNSGYVTQAKDGDGWYNALTDSFLVGRLSLPVEPDPNLLALPDPYDPILSKPYKVRHDGPYKRIHDISLYKGKLYMYFGPTPIVTLYLPVRLLTGLKVKDNYACVFFLFGGFLFAVALLFHLREHYFNQISDWVMYVVVLVLGFANVAPFILSMVWRQWMYDVALSSGFFFLTGSIYCFCKAFSTWHPNLKLLLIGSLFLGLSVGGRPHYILSGIVIPLMLVKIFNGKPEKKYIIKSFLALVLPYACCIFLLGLYNHLRFDNPFEFGLSYQLTAYNFQRIKLFAIEYILSSLKFLLFENPHVNLNLPFLHMVPPVRSIELPKFHQHVHDLVGIFPGIPFTLLLFIAPIIYWIKMLLTCSNACKKNKVLLFSIISMIIISICLKVVPTILNSCCAKVDCMQGLSVILEKISYVIPFIPFCVLVLVGNIFYWLKGMRTSCQAQCQVKIVFPTFEFWLILLPALLIFCGLLILGAVSMRYIADFATLLILAACVIWFYIDSRLGQMSLSRFLLMSLALMLSVISIIFGMAFGTHRYFNNLRRFNPIEYNRIRTSYKILWDLLFAIVSGWSSLWRGISE